MLTTERNATNRALNHIKKLCRPTVDDRLVLSEESGQTGISLNRGFEDDIALGYLKATGATAHCPAIMVQHYADCLLSLKQRLALTFASLVPLSVAVMTTCLLVVTAAVVILGMTLSAIGPLVIAMVGRYFPHVQSIAVGLVCGAGAAGPLSFLFIMAPIAGTHGVATAMWTYVVVLVVMASNRYHAVATRCRQRTADDRLI